MESMGSVEHGVPTLHVRTRHYRGLFVAAGIALALGSSVAACTSSAASPGAASELQKQADLYAINQIEVKWHEASSTKNLDLMMTLWADNATFTTASQTYNGKDAIRTFFATQAAPFKPENNWVSDTPAYKSRVTVDGDKGTLYFQCDYIDVDTREVKVVVSADQQVARINGTWVIISTIAATPGLGY
ncbi:MAG TPA: nuclear transport factor 2 family protein [Candidatus Limnocylindrales bacterium]|jgi:ketosteroid isomerase-like protein|nr:nuclear transport factor 2 family protein [Candidatus Limnocylindrales bacterium]